MRALNRVASAVCICVLLVGCSGGSGTPATPSPSAASPNQYADTSALLADLGAGGIVCDTRGSPVITDEGATGGVWCVASKRDPFTTINIAFYSSAQEVRAAEDRLLESAPTQTVAWKSVDGGSWSVAVGVAPYDRGTLDSLTQKVVDVTGGKVVVDLCAQRPDAGVCSGA